MILNASVAIYVPTVTKNSAGTVTKAWGYKHTPKLNPAFMFDADVHPASLSAMKLAEWGYDSIPSDTKLLFADPSISAAKGSRAYVTDYTGASAYYDIMGVNAWPRHVEMLLFPVQGE